jgi:dienelactone hydrolase
LFLLFCGVGHAQVFDYYKNAPLNFTQKEMDNRDGVRLSSCSFETKDGKANGYLVEPTAAGAHPAIVWMHSNGPLNWVADATLLAQSGAVSLIIDPPSGGGNDAEAFRNAMIDAVVAIRRAVDVLETRQNVDPKRIAYVGHSFGAMMGANAISVDRRFRAAVFEVGLLGMDVHIATSPHPWAAGIRKDLGDKLPAFLKAIEPLDTSHFLPQAPHIPLLFQSARYDPGVPEKDSLDFYNIANQPKELKWYPSGHDVSDIHAIGDRAQFLARHLGLPERAGTPIVVVISMDGFPAYALDNDKLPIPTLRRLIKEGAWAKRMTIVNPTVTWPNHTTMVTGVDARRHGVLFNGLLNRDAVPPKVEPWIDKEKWVKARTVYDAAFEAGLTTAQVDWVAIYNAKTITWQFADVNSKSAASSAERTSPVSLRKAMRRGAMRCGRRPRPTSSGSISRTCSCSTY